MKAKTKRRRPNLPRIADEMKQWSAILGAELQGWPHITAKPMFGMLGFYRKKTVFAALPVTRGIGSANSIIFKIEPMPPELLRRRDQDPRVCPAKTIRTK